MRDERPTVFVAAMSAYVMPLVLPVILPRAGSAPAPGRGSATVEAEFERIVHDLRRSEGPS